MPLGSISGDRCSFQVEEFTFGTAIFPASTRPFLHLPGLNLFRREAKPLLIEGEHFQACHLIFYWLCSFDKLLEAWVIFTCGEHPHHCPLLQKYSSTVTVVHCDFYRVNTHRIEDCRALSALA